MSDQRIQDEGITANQIVFSFWLPHPRDNQQLDFSRWQQTLMGVLILEVGYDPKFELGKKKRLDCQIHVFILQCQFHFTSYT